MDLLLAKRELGPLKSEEREGVVRIDRGARVPVRKQRRTHIHAQVMQAQTVGWWGGGGGGGGLTAATRSRSSRCVPCRRGSGWRESGPEASDAPARATEEEEVEVEGDGGEEEMVEEAVLAREEVVGSGMEEG